MEKLFLSSAEIGLSDLGPPLDIQVSFLSQGGENTILPSGAELSVLLASDGLGAIGQRVRLHCELVATDTQLQPHLAHDRAVHWTKPNQTTWPS